MTEDSRERIVEMLATGKSLSEICRLEDMPAWSTVHRWIDDDSEFAGQVTRAREIGYQHRAEQAVEVAKRAEDAALGRLALDAERWFLGKLSNAFSDDKARKHEHSGPGGSPIATTQRIERVIIDPANRDG
jgi:transposase-like protein